MIKNDREFRVTLDRIAHLQNVLENLRRTEGNATNYRLSAGGYLAEIDRMNLDVREYLSLHPSELQPAV